jgi:hypothetical protein
MNLRGLDAVAYPDEGAGKEIKCLKPIPLTA